MCIRDSTGTVVHGRISTCNVAEELERCSRPTDDMRQWWLGMRSNASIFLDSCQVCDRVSAPDGKEESVV